VSLEHGFMVGGLIVCGDIFFFCLHLIGEKLNRDYRNEGKKCVEDAEVGVGKSAVVETVVGSYPEPATATQSLDSVEI